MAKSTKTTLQNNKMMSLSKDDAGVIITARILIVVIIGLITASLFDYVKGEANREFAFRMNIYPVLLGVFAGLLVLSIAYWIFTSLKKIDTSAHVATPGMLTVIFAYLLTAILFYDKFRTSPTFFYTLTAIGCVLVGVYYIYIILLYKK